MRGCHTCGGWPRGSGRGPGLGGAQRGGWKGGRRADGTRQEAGPPTHAGGAGEVCVWGGRVV